MQGLEPRFHIGTFHLAGRRMLQHIAPYRAAAPSGTGNMYRTHFVSKLGKADPSSRWQKTRPSGWRLPQ
jgi:hypothetical protein